MSQQYLFLYLFQADVVPLAKRFVLLCVSLSQAISAMPNLLPPWARWVAQSCSVARSCIGLVFRCDPTCQSEPVGHIQCHPAFNLHARYSPMHQIQPRTSPTLST